tara:strand:+ start:289 stop:489 length:201 start_codon:yes stop_codon:yes gene_type:complete
MPKLKVFVERENKNLEVEANSMKDLFSKVNVNPETVIISKNNELVVDDVELRENDEIKLLSVISGG